MAKPTYTHDTKPAVDSGWGNALIPGPTHKTDTDYSDGSTRTGYGHSKTESRNNSRSPSKSSYKSGGSSWW